MSEPLLHPTPDRLEALVEGALADGDRAAMESHLLSCARCQSEVEEWRALFGLLAGLPHFAPAAGFVDRVMAGVRVRQPWAARLAEALARLLPRTTRAWALVTALLALPVLAGTGLMAWLLSRPGLTPLTLWLFVRDRTADAVFSLAGRAAGSVLETSVALWLVRTIEELLGAAGLAEIGIAAALFGTLTVLSAWILYQNLFRTPTRESHYASYSL